MKQVQLFNHYDNVKKLDQMGSIIAEYLWIDGSGVTIRSKSKTLTKKINSLADLPEWNYDGSSCYQASTHNSEVIMKPVFYCQDPFRGGDNIIVLCDTWVWADEHFTKLIPANTSFRHHALKIFEACKDQQPQFGIEQEYSVLATHNMFSTIPLGWPKKGYPGPQGPYYCSVGAQRCFGRSIMDAHYKACVYAGLKIAGTNVETLPGQLEYQIGPCEGIESGDHLWISRYLLWRVAEDFNISVSFEPKLFKDYNGAGCHTNYSSKAMREGQDGMDGIISVIKKLEAKKDVHLEVYGDNSKRLTGQHETSKLNEFTYGIGNRGASIRIPSTTANQKKGYIEDRRPASNMDPYIVTAMVADSTLLDQSKADSLLEAYRAWKKWVVTQKFEM